MYDQSQRIIERHRLFSASEMRLHGFLHAVAFIIGTFGAGFVAVLCATIVADIILLPAVVMMFLIPPIIHLCDIYHKIATTRRMLRLASITATWLALGVPTYLLVALGGYPLLNYCIAVSATFVVMVILSMIVWCVCIGFGGTVTVVSEDRCFHCGYDLQGNVSGICPECGAVVVDVLVRDAK